MNVAARIRNRIAEYPRTLWLLAVGSFLNIAGMSFLWPLNAIYIHEQLGKPLTVAGIVLLLNSAGSTVGQLTGGFLYDRLGARPVMLTGLFSAAAVIALPAIFGSWPLYVTAMVLFGFCGALAFPAMNALAAKAWPAGGRRAFNFLYVANNLGVAFGTAIGGIIAERSFGFAFLAAATMLFIFGLFAFRFIHDRPGIPVSADAARTLAAPVAPEGSVPWVPIIALFSALCLCWLVYVQWQGVVSVHMKDVGYDLSAYSVLWTLNGLLIFAGQPLLAFAVRHLKSLSSQMAMGAALFAVAFALLLAPSHRYGLFIASMVVLTFGEMFIWPVIPAAVARLSPPSRRGSLQGLIGSGATLGRMLGPLYGGLLYDHFGYPTLMTTSVAVLAVPLISIAVYARTRRGREVVDAGAD
ncbi:MAG: hypothetical protein JWN15_945 [Firmicutes bacterium]|nr:hypothetical protein [Bacillota bacterium]